MEARLELGGAARTGRIVDAERRQQPGTLLASGAAVFHHREDRRTQVIRVLALKAGLHLVTLCGRTLLVQLPLADQSAHRFGHQQGVPKLHFPAGFIADDHEGFQLVNTVDLVRVGDAPSADDALVGLFDHAWQLRPILSSLCSRLRPQSPREFTDRRFKTSHPQVIPITRIAPSPPCCVVHERIEWHDTYTPLRGGGF